MPLKDCVNWFLGLDVSDITGDDNESDYIVCESKIKSPLFLISPRTLLPKIMGSDAD